MILTRGGNGSRYNDVGGGGGAGGRISMYFRQNKTFSEFRYLSNGGWPGLVSEISRSESGDQAQSSYITLATITAR